MSLPACVIPCDEVALVDAAAAAMGVDIAALMERAGSLLADEAQRMAGSGAILIATGSGNNGGDGWVCARVLQTRGQDVAVWPLSAPRSPLCRAAASAAREAGVAVLSAAPQQRPALLVDAILGAGASGPPRPALGTALKQLAALGAEILAADVPTGLGSEDLLPARLTLCFQLAKQELLTDPRIGEFKTVDLGIPPAAWQEVQPAVFARFPRHHRAGHKGDNGELLVIGGGAFPGALEFACRAGLASGCDMVRAWTSEGPPLPPSIVVQRLPGRHLAPHDPDLLAALIARASALLIGPGLGRDAGTPEAARQAFMLAQEMAVPVVVDADAIHHLVAELRGLPTDAMPVLVTPHRGELRVLVGEASEEAAHAFARPDRVLLCKSAIDFISDGRRWQRNPTGNPRMAVGGSGDCLAGLAAGLLARGCQPFDAARLATRWLCQAADGLWQERGPCWIPEDLLAALPTALRSFLEALGIWPPLADLSPAPAPTVRPT